MCLHITIWTTGEIFCDSNFTNTIKASASKPEGKQEGWAVFLRWLLFTGRGYWPGCHHVYCHRVPWHHGVLIYLVYADLSLCKDLGVIWMMLRYKASPLPLRRPECNRGSRDVHVVKQGLLSPRMSRLPSTPPLQTVAVTTVIRIHHYKANDVSCKGQRMELLIS